MRLRAVPVLVFAIVGSAVLPGAAAADPITIAFDVHVSQVRLGGPGVPIAGPTPVDERFTVSLTFDPAVVPPGTGGRGYAVSGISPIPLAPFPPAGLETRSLPGIAIHDTNGFGGYFASASQTNQLGLGVLDGQQAFFVGVARFENSVRTPLSPLTISPETFAAHLAWSPLGSPFNFTYEACLDIGPTEAACQGQLPGSVRAQYFGVATLSDAAAAPVPEPGTVILVGAGLAILARRRGARQNRS